MKIENKVKIAKSCAEGKHTFIPCHWSVKQNSRSCTLFVCQHCLVTVDKSEREQMMNVHHEKIKAKDSKEKQ